ncbi:MAG: GlmU family protein [Bacteroidia bacterium]|nr:GlmU family protein [Bacteroidia bacterium]
MLLSFFDDAQIDQLYPLTLTRPAADIRCGLLTIASKWCHLLHATAYGFDTRDYLQAKFNSIEHPNLRINGRLLPNPELLNSVRSLQDGQSLMANGTLLASKPGQTENIVEFAGTVAFISRPYDVFLQLKTEIETDIHLVIGERDGQLPSQSNRIIGPDRLFIEEGAKVEGAIFNTQNGPIYIGKNAEVMEGCLVRGPFAMAEGSVLKLGTKVYGPTALGPYCVAGGEINNIQMQAFSNKGHDGFLGNAVLGEWCNIGADSNCSNLKNNYEDVKVWNYNSGRFEKSGQQFCGLIMGDHSKCGINTMFNTGTVVGVSANIFGSGFPRQFIPDFAWGGASGFVTYKPDAAFKTASLVMPRRKKEFTEVEQNILQKVFDMTGEYRNWE